MFPAAKILPVVLDAAPLQAFGGMIILRGWALLNPNPAASVQVVMYDGTNNTGTPIAVVDLLPSESTREWFSDGGIAVESGLYIEVGSDVVGGSIFYSDASLYGGIAFVNGAIEAWSGRL